MVARRAEIEKLQPLAARRAPDEVFARLAARGDDRVIEIVRNVELVEERDDAFGRPRRVGEEHDRTARRAEPAHGVDGRVELLAAVVQDAPDVADGGVVIGGDFGEA